MANITLTLEKLKEIQPIDEVVLKWHSGIRVSRLKKFLLDGADILSEDEKWIWSLVCSKKGYLYGFAGHLDTANEERECYNEDKSKDEVFHMNRLSLNIDRKRIAEGKDYKLDIGKVVDQTIAERMEQHFNDDNYLEHFRKDAKVYFPTEIVPDEKHMDEYIDTLETILIKGNVEMTPQRLGVCNETKIDDPKLQYPIKKISNQYIIPAFEKDIYVTIAE